MKKSAVVLFLNFIMLYCFTEVALANAISKRPIQFEDIVTTEKPKLVKIAPDGIKVAFVLEKSNIQENKVTDTLYVWDKNIGSAKELLTLDKIQKILWIQNTVYVLGQKEKKYQIFRIDNSKITLLMYSLNPISTFATVNHNKLYYSQAVSTSEQTLKKSREEGYVYRWGQDTVSNLINKNYGHYEFEEIWCLDIPSGKKQFLTKFDFKNYFDRVPLISTLELSPDGNKLAININRLGKPELGAPASLMDLVVFDIQKNKNYNLLVKHQITIKGNPCWINNNELVFVEENYIKQEVKLWIWNGLTNKINQLNFNIGHQWPTNIVWNNEKNCLVVVCDKILYRISIAKDTIEKIKIPENFPAKNYWDDLISFDQNLHFLATTIEDANTPPQVILYDLKTKKLTTLTSLNPGIKDIVLGRIESITVKTQDDITTQGFLIYPVNYKPGKHYPLIIGTYGFNGQRYALNAEEWHSSFPAQMFAKEGCFILLLNVVRDNSQAMVNAPKQARDELGWQQLKVFEHAVTMLVNKNLIDANKVGLYGWSHGAFVVEFLITHSNKFQVASIGEGGDYNPGEFWHSGYQLWPKIFNNTFGGPPWGKTLKNYLDFSPFFNVDKIKTPLLMEFSTSSILGLEMYVPLRYLNIPAELVVYDGEEHNFVKPKARIASMKRKVDWFNYWFFNKRDQAEPEQYVRWDQMRTSFNNAHSK